MNTETLPTSTPNLIQVPLVLSYKGTATQGGIIDALVFSNSLQGFADLITATNRVLYENRSDIRVIVKSEFKEGSFEFAVEVVQHLLAHAQSYIDTPEEVASVLWHIGLIGGSTVGGIGATFATTFTAKFGTTLGQECATSLIGLLRKTKGEKVKVIDDGKSDEHQATIEHNGVTIKVPKQVFDLYKDRQVREGLERFSSPISQKGYDSIQAKDGEEVMEEIVKQDFFYFETSDKPEFISEEPFEGRFIIVDARLIGQGKWRVRHENNKKEFDVVVRDKNFLNDVKGEKISFISGDRLHLKGVIKHDQSGRGLESEYFSDYAKKVRRAPKKNTTQESIQFDLDLKPKK